jgi:hypothetical protein
MSGQPFETQDERLKPEGPAWGAQLWRELTWTPKSGHEYMSLLRVLLNGVVVSGVLASLIFFLGLVTIALVKLCQVVF